MFPFVSFNLEYITLDIFNNSAWSYRFYVFTHEEGSRFCLHALQRSSEAIDAEIDYVLRILEQSSHNDAAWNYLKGLRRFYAEHSFDEAVAVAKRIAEQKEAVNALDFLIMYDRSCYDLNKMEEAIDVFLIQ